MPESSKGKSGKRSRDAHQKHTSESCAGSSTTISPSEIQHSRTETTHRKEPKNSDNQQSEGETLNSDEYGEQSEEDHLQVGEKNLPSLERNKKSVEIKEQSTEKNQELVVDNQKVVGGKRYIGHEKQTADENQKSTESNKESVEINYKSLTDYQSEHREQELTSQGHSLTLTYKQELRTWRLYQAVLEQNTDHPNAGLMNSYIDDFEKQMRMINLFTVKMKTAGTDISDKLKNRIYDCRKNISGIVHKVTSLFPNAIQAAMSADLCSSPKQTSKVDLREPLPDTKVVDTQKLNSKAARKLTFDEPWAIIKDTNKILAEKSDKLSFKYKLLIEGRAEKERPSYSERRHEKLKEEYIENKTRKQIRSERLLSKLKGKRKTSKDAQQDYGSVEKEEYITSQTWTNCNVPKPLSEHTQQEKTADEVNRFILEYEVDSEITTTEPYIKSKTCSHISSSQPPDCADGVNRMVQQTIQEFEMEAYEIAQKEMDKLTEHSAELKNYGELNPKNVVQNEIADPSSSAQDLVEEDIKNITQRLEDTTTVRGEEKYYKELIESQKKKIIEQLMESKKDAGTRRAQVVKCSVKHPDNNTGLSTPNDNEITNSSNTSKKQRKRARKRQAAAAAAVTAHETMKQEYKVDIIKATSLKINLTSTKSESTGNTVLEGDKLLDLEYKKYIKEPISPRKDNATATSDSPSSTEKKNIVDSLFMGFRAAAHSKQYRIMESPGHENLNLDDILFMPELTNEEETIKSEISDDKDTPRGRRTTKKQRKKVRKSAADQRYDNLQVSSLQDIQITENHDHKNEKTKMATDFVPQFITSAVSSPINSVMPFFGVQNDSEEIVPTEVEEITEINLMIGNNHNQMDKLKISQGYTNKSLEMNMSDGKQLCNKNNKQRRRNLERSASSSKSSTSTVGQKILEIKKEVDNAGEISSTNHSEELDELISKIKYSESQTITKSTNSSPDVIKSINSRKGDIHEGKEKDLSELTLEDKSDSGETYSESSMKGGGCENAISSIATNTSKKTISVIKESTVISLLETATQATLPVGPLEAVKLLNITSDTSNILLPASESIITEVTTSDSSVSTISLTIVPNKDKTRTPSEISKSSIPKSHVSCAENTCENSEKPVAISLVSKVPKRTTLVPGGTLAGIHIMGGSDINTPVVYNSRSLSPSSDSFSPGRLVSQIVQKPISGSDNSKDVIHKPDSHETRSSESARFIDNVSKQICSPCGSSMHHQMSYDVDGRSIQAEEMNIREEESEKEESEWHTVPMRSTTRSRSRSVPSISVRRALYSPQIPRVGHDLRPSPRTRSSPLQRGKHYLKSRYAERTLGHGFVLETNISGKCNLSDLAEDDREDGGYKRRHLQSRSYQSNAPSDGSSFRGFRDWFTSRVPFNRPRFDFSRGPERRARSRSRSDPCGWNRRDYDGTYSQYSSVNSLIIPQTEETYEKEYPMIVKKTSESVSKGESVSESMSHDNSLKKPQIKQHLLQQDLKQSQEEDTQIHSMAPISRTLTSENKESSEKEENIFETEVNEPGCTNYISYYNLSVYFHFFRLAALKALFEQNNLRTTTEFNSEIPSNTGIRNIKYVPSQYLEFLYADIFKMLIIQWKDMEGFCVLDYDTDTRTRTSNSFLIRANRHPLGCRCLRLPQVNSIRNVNVISEFTKWQSMPNLIRPEITCIRSPRSNFRKVKNIQYVNPQTGFPFPIGWERREKSRSRSRRKSESEAETCDCAQDSSTNKGLIQSEHPFQFVPYGLFTVPNEEEDISRILFEKISPFSRREQDDPATETNIAFLKESQNSFAPETESYIYVPPHTEGVPNIQPHREVDYNKPRTISGISQQENEQLNTLEATSRHSSDMGILAQSHSGVEDIVHPMPEKRNVYQCDVNSQFSTQAGYGAELARSIPGSYHYHPDSNISVKSLSSTAYLDHSTHDLRAVVQPHIDADCSVQPVSGKEFLIQPSSDQTYAAQSVPVPPFVNLSQPTDGSSIQSPSGVPITAQPGFGEGGLNLPKSSAGIFLPSDINAEILAQCATRTRTLSQHQSDRRPLDEHHSAARMSLHSSFPAQPLSGRAILSQPSFSADIASQLLPSIEGSSSQPRFGAGITSRVQSPAEISPQPHPSNCMLHQSTSPSEMFPQVTYTGTGISNPCLYGSTILPQTTTNSVILSQHCAGTRSYIHHIPNETVSIQDPVTTPSAIRALAEPQLHHQTETLPLGPVNSETLFLRTHMNPYQVIFCPIHYLPDSACVWKGLLGSLDEHIKSRHSSIYFREESVVLGPECAAILEAFGEYFLVYTQSRSNKLHFIAQHMTCTDNKCPTFTYSCIVYGRLNIPLFRQAGVVGHANVFIDRFSSISVDWSEIIAGTESSEFYIRALIKLEYPNREINKIA